MKVQGMRLFISTMVFVAAVSSTGLLRAQDEAATREPSQPQSSEQATMEETGRFGWAKAQVAGDSAATGRVV